MQYFIKGHCRCNFSSVMQPIGYFVVWKLVLECCGSNELRLVAFYFKFWHMSNGRCLYYKEAFMLRVLNNVIEKRGLIVVK